MSQPSSHSIPPVVTVLEPAERSSVDAAGTGLYRTLHRDSLDQVRRDLRERRISAVIVSVARCVREEPAQVRAVVRDFPRIPTVALVSGSVDTAPEAVLALGNCGVRTLVDVRYASGWGKLRDVLGVEATKDVDRLATSHLRRDLAGVRNDCWRFFETLFANDFRASTVRVLARRLGVLPSTMMSRFFRAGLPAPKKYLAYARLVRAARLFENPGMSVSDVANHLDYSSPQSFGRHVRNVLGMSAGAFRRRYNGESMLQRLRDELIAPHITVLRSSRLLSQAVTIGEVLPALPIEFPRLQRPSRPVPHPATMLLAPRVPRLLQ